MAKFSGRRAGKRRRPQGGRGGAQGQAGAESGSWSATADTPRDYEHEHDDYNAEAAGEDFVEETEPKVFGQDEDEMEEDEGESEAQPSSMLFDFRRGDTRWPRGVELLSPATAAAELAKKRETLEKQGGSKAAIGPEPRPGAYTSTGFGSDDLYGKGRTGPAGGDDSDDSEVGEGLEPWAEDADELGDEFDPDLQASDDPEQQAEARAAAAERAAAAAEARAFSPAPAGARFVTLSDGSTAFLVPGGWRLKLDLSDLLDGGDANRERREKLAARKAKSDEKRERRVAASTGGGDGWGIDASDSGWDFLATMAAGGGGGSSTSRWGLPDKVGTWTITMDLKIADEAKIPHEGISLVHTSLVHAEETKGRTKLNQSNGEAMINCDGGVGQLGTFGDVSKARVEPGKWHRIVICVKCATQANEKGELRTWIDTVPGCVLKSDAVAAPGRFELDTEHLFLFSSSDAAMMPGNVLLRTVRVEQRLSTDATVLEDRARDKIISMLNEERIKKIDAQRAGLSLASLFSKPRPIWSTPALIGTFGDAFIEGTGLDGSSCLAWSFTVLNHAFQKTLRRPRTREILVGFSPEEFGVVSDVFHVLSRSAPVFKQMARLIKNSTQNQLMTFLRRVKKIINKVGVGEAVLLPVIVEGKELLILLSRATERYFDLVVIATDPVTSLRYHAVNAARAPPRVQYRTALVLNRVEKKIALDDVFWAATFNLTARHKSADVTGDMKRFYDLLLPFLTNKPLEQSLIEAEEIALAKELAATEAINEPDQIDEATLQEGQPTTETVSSFAEPAAEPPATIGSDATVTRATIGGSTTKQDSRAKSTQHVSGDVGAWRFPQRSATAYVRCIFEAIHFLLTNRGGLSDIKASQVQLALQAQLVDFIGNDLDFVHPEDNGRRVCEMALSTFSDAAVQLSETFAENTAKAGEESPEAKAVAAEVEASFVKNVPSLVHSMVKSVAGTLNAVADNVDSLPSLLDLSDGTETVLARSQDKKCDGDSVSKQSLADGGLDPLASSSSSEAAKMQFRDLMCWEVDSNSPDPGQAVTLRKYEAVNMLLIAERANTREEAIDAIRLCDEQCVMLSNQEHCVKNPKFLIAALIEHVFVQVVATPKPRAVPWMDERAKARAAAVTKRRAELSVKKAEEKAARAAEWVSFRSGNSNTQGESAARKGDAAAAKRRAEAAAAEAETARKNAQEVLGSGSGTPDEDENAARGEAAATDEAVDFSAGKAFEDAAVQEPCYWDEDVTAEMQVELLLCLRRLSDHFSAAALSIQHSRAFDSVCMVVPGLIASIADCILRRLASDRPSKFTGVLLGLSAGDGRRLGFPGFGLSVGSFAEQTETMEVHYPELSLARTAVIDYFTSPDQRRLDKVFDWEVDYVMRPTRNLIKMLRHVCRSLAWTSVSPHMLLTDSTPESSLLFKQFPELRAFRDIATMWKFWLNPDLDEFPNYTPPQHVSSPDGQDTTPEFDRHGNPVGSTADVAQQDFMGAQLCWQWDQNEKGYNVTSFNGAPLTNPDNSIDPHRVRCRPNPKKVDRVTNRPVPAHKIPKHRYPSTATPSFYCPSKPAVKTEDDVIYRPNLPTFDDDRKPVKSPHTGGSASTSHRASDASSKGSVLSQRDSELLLSFLTVPYMRLPLVWTFFASEDRVHKLQSSKLQAILDSVTFEPGRHLRVCDTGVMPEMVPTTHPRLLATPYGLLINELHCSPANVLRSMVALLTGALALDTGAVCDRGAEDFNTGVEIILYVTRLVARVDNFVSFLVDVKTRRHPCLSGVTLRGVEVSDECLDELTKGLTTLRGLMQDQVAPLIEEYLSKLDRETTASPGDEALIDRNSRLSCDLHAHRLLLYRNLHLDELETEKSQGIIATTLSSFLYLTTRHTWNKAARAHGKLLVPEHELYELLQVVRRRMIRWVQRQPQGGVDTVLQTALQVSSSTTGSGVVELDSANRWASLAGVQCEGRYAVASRRTTARQQEDGTDSNGPDPGQGLSRAASAQQPVGQVANTALLGVELDLQIGQMTLRSKHLQALSSDVANHPDVKLIFGENTMQASLLERAEHRKRFRLVGLGHEVEVWPAGHGDCPSLGEEWDREYDPSEMDIGERWIAKLFEPVRKAFFNGPQPPPMQFSMAEKVPDDAEVAVLVGLHQVLGGPFKLVWIHRRLKCVQVFECVSQGRQWWFTQHMTTDCRFSLRELQPSVDDREQPYPKWWTRGAGSPYPKGVSKMLANNLMDNTGDHLYKSVVIKRDASHTGNFSGGTETFVPKRLLLGIIPQSLLDSYLFWQDEAIEPTGVLSGVASAVLEGGDIPSPDGDGMLPSLNPGYRRLRGYPRDDAKGVDDTIILVEFQTIGSWDDTQDFFAAFGNAEASAPSDKIDVTRMPGRTLRVSRLPLGLVKEDIEQRRRIAACLEPLNLLVSHTPSRKRSKSHKRTSSKAKKKGGKRTRKSSESGEFAVGALVEFDTDGTSNRWVQCEILKAHPGGKLYDVEPKEAWVGRQTRVPVMFLRAMPKGRSNHDSEAVGVWKFEGLSDSEDEEWEEEADLALRKEAGQGNAEQQSDDDDRGAKKSALTFDQLDRLQYVASACGGDEATCMAVLRKLAADPTAGPFTDVRALADAVATEAESVPELQAVVARARTNLIEKATRDAQCCFELLNLLTAPRRSRLHSLLKTLVRIENAGHILAWAKRSSIMHILSPSSLSTDTNVPWAVASASPFPWWSILASGSCGSEYLAAVGCPPIDLVELPRLKLSFTARKDYTGVERLYSLDHSDLFVSNERQPLVNKMIQGIPHSLLLSNLEGELQVLVPIIRPVRPRVISEPFTTSLVLDRSDDKWNSSLASRYFMYPVHVSTSFLLTKGLHAAMYLLLLRLLHRDYDQVFRLTDSVSTDTAFAPEGQVIFNALSLANSDCHPDCHACRLKVSLVTMDSGTELPWDLTNECARYALKLDCVAAACGLSEEEELQILETKTLIVTDESHAKYDRKIHDVYHLTVVKNRLSCLSALSKAETEGDCATAIRISECSHPPRAESSSWPYFIDDTALGETYAGIKEVESADSFDEMLTGPEYPKRPIAENVPPADTDESAQHNRDSIRNITAFSAYLALRQYEQYNGLERGSADLEALEKTPLGIVGWAYGSDKALTRLDGGSDGADVGGSDAADTDYSSLGPPPLESYAFLSVVVFHVLWSPACVKAMPLIEQLAPATPAARFLAVRADRAGVDAISRAFNVTTFPTILVFRGAGESGEVARIEGPERSVSQLSAVVASMITLRDETICEALDAQASFEERFGRDPSAALSLIAAGSSDPAASGDGPIQISGSSSSILAAFQATLTEDDGDEQTDLTWTWDPEFAADNIRIADYGNTIAYVDDDDDDDEVNDDMLLAAARWQTTDGTGWVDIQDPACILQCERQYRMGRLFVEGQMIALGPEEGFEITIDQKKFKIVDDEITGMSARKSADPYSNLECRRKGARVKVRGDEKYIDKAQRARDRYEAEWKQTLQDRAEEAKAKLRGRDVQGTRGTHSFTEETGVYTWACKWCHEPVRGGSCDAVGICSEVAEGFGPFETPLLGAKGGVSLGLYANGDLVHQGVIIAELTSGSKRSLEAAAKANSGFSTTADQGESEEDGIEGSLTAGGADVEPKCYSGHPLQLSDRPIGTCNYCYETGTAWHCGFCNYNMCNKCYSTKMQELVDQAKEQKRAKADNEKEPEDEETEEEVVEPEPEPEPELEPEPEPDEPEPELEQSAKEGAPSPKKKKKRLQDLLPKERKLEEKDLCSLFGRNSLVTLSLDTDKGGGTLSFEVDGVKLVDKRTGQTSVPNCFQLLSTSQIFPAVVMGPADPEPAFPEADPPSLVGTADSVPADVEEKKKSKKKSKKKGGADNGDDEDDEAAAKDREREEQQVISDIAHMCRVPFADVEDLDEQKRAELRRRARELLKRRVPAVALVLGDPESQEAAQAQSKAGADDKADESTTQGGEDGDADADAERERVAKAAMTVPFTRVIESLEIEFKTTTSNGEEDGEKEKKKKKKTGEEEEEEKEEEEEDDVWVGAKVTKVVAVDEATATKSDDDASDSSDDDDASDSSDDDDSSAQNFKTKLLLDLELSDGTERKGVILDPLTIRGRRPQDPIQESSPLEVWDVGAKKWLPGTCTAVQPRREPEPEAEPESASSTNSDPQGGHTTFDVRYTDGEQEQNVQAERVRLFRPVLIGPDDPEPTPLTVSSDPEDVEGAGDSQDTMEVPIERVVWMFESQKGWEPHSAEVSKQMEEALREGRTEIMLMVGEMRYTMKLVKTAPGGQQDSFGGDSQSTGGPEQENDDGQKQRLRRHVRSGDGLQADWEMLSLMYSPPLSMVGNSAMSVLEKAWGEGDSLNGQKSGLGFLFLYQLLRGTTRVSVISSGGYADMWASRRSGGKNDAHRFALLLHQLMKDSSKRGLMSSCVSTLVRNRHVCVRAPKFRDSRKMRQSPVFNGWTDENEPSSPVSELFSKLVPFLQRLKRQRGALRYPPTPPYPEMKAMPETIRVISKQMLPFEPVSSHSPDDQDAVEIGGRLRAALSDASCSLRHVAPVTAAEVYDLAKSVRFDLGKYGAPETLPIEIEEIEHFEAVADSAADDDKLLIVDFFADWCGPCKQFAPMFRQFAVRFGTVAVFVKADIDENEALAERFSIKSVPTLLFMRGGNGVAHVQDRIEGGGAGMAAHFMATLQKLAKRKDLEGMAQWEATRGPSFGSALGIEVTGEALKQLSLCPLGSLSAAHVCLSTRTERGLAAVDGKLEALDGVASHESASSAVAKSMLERMTADVAAYAADENARLEGRIHGLGDVDLATFFTAKGDNETIMQAARASLSTLLATMKGIRNEDARSISDVIPLLRHAANYVQLGHGDEAHEQLGRTLFVLKQACRRVPEISVEFLFGATLSSRGETDIANLNPYLNPGTLNLLLRLIGVTMLRANRVGHANRCIGMCVRLLGLVDKALKTEPSERGSFAETLLPQIAQASAALADGLQSRRHFMAEVADPSSSSLPKGVHVQYDPRFLIFEFVWNILLRQKQVEIVNMFREGLKDRRSKVKQMIMGAGKTTVVAPLLALCLADGESLVLSVVPKALLEMSRKQMRETFATIITKRIYTLSFDRGTIVTAAMHRSLQNAKRNRGVVVATPTTLKSIQLVYVETLQRLDTYRREGPFSKVQELSFECHELAKILQTFREGVLLLDEVDMVLHPLKSELNFPIGEKFDLDGADQGERWSLPTHLVDAIFFVQCRRVTTFEQSGGALDILNRLSSAIDDGYRAKSLQRLPHVTLLDPEYYHNCLKPLLAEWAYLWLQKQHLHGIERDEAIKYTLEGAVARSDLALKLRIINTAIAEVQVKLGEMPAEPELTTGYRSTVTADQLAQHDEDQLQLMRQSSAGLAPGLEEQLRRRLSMLMDACSAAEDQFNMMEKIFAIEDRLEGHLHSVSKRSLELTKEMAHLQQEIEELQNPRDDSLDNDTVVWCSHDAFKPGQAGMSGEPVDDDEEDYDAAAGASSEDGVSRSTDSVHAIINVLEEAGLVCKRCSDPIEAIDRARELQRTKRLRCVIFGGGEKTGGCGKSCRRNHANDGPCIRCGHEWYNHDPRTHNCYSPLPTQSVRRGSFAANTSKGSVEKKMQAVEFFAELTAEPDSVLARGIGVLPTERTCLYAGNAAVKEDTRLKLWSMRTPVRDGAAALNEFVDAVPAWPTDEPDENESDDDAEHSEQDDGVALTRQQSIGSARLDECRRRLAECEAEKSLLEDADEEQKNRLHSDCHDQHTKLMQGVQQRLDLFEKALAKLHELELSTTTEPVEPDSKNSLGNLDIGPVSGRNAALALAWLATQTPPKLGKACKKWRMTLAASMRAVRSEQESLRRIALAAKVMAFIPSPTHKKLLNLTHDWLRTYLPHCLSKVNRVSFGLLSSEECAAALEEDPFAPRSRLALAVPFIGKDVPAKSAEFAHPDICLGLTVMAYRYSGLRDGDFSDLIDALSSEFAHEIGPARERPSSLRYESWVHAAGGTVRGVASQHSKLAAAAVPDRADPAEREVVQLKFLQKSNQEQMEKLRQMWNREPLVLHYYLAKFVFPEHMRTQRYKLSASGQSVGGDMLVGRRVGFSGTPSDLLPKELGQCDYEQGDDGKMLSTVLDPTICSTEVLDDGWTVPILLQKIAGSSVFRALIDTGALITGYSNQEVAAELLRLGLPWCDGVVFLDDADKQQVLVRATGRVVSADQCGVPLERRFAFYDQIHTTGMDIKHVVNATAVITLGKDMVFRDYVQGAYRMRGIGKGQKIHCLLIPEVANLMKREAEAARNRSSAGGVGTTDLTLLKDFAAAELTEADMDQQLEGDEAATADAAAQPWMLDVGRQCRENPAVVLRQIVAWLVVNSLRSESVQWSMLCIQNVGNVFRKTAFEVMLRAGSNRLADLASDGVEVPSMQAPLDAASDDPVDHLSPGASIDVFTEPIDFSLDSAVPDPAPFEVKLRKMLEDHVDFIPDAAAHAVGQSILTEVGRYSNLEGATNRLESEQEREQEQEQQKEVKARRDQQVEIEKFVDREYSRNQEAPKPWPLSALLNAPALAPDDDGEEHSDAHDSPFYRLRHFKLRHQDSLNMPDQLLCSRNYFNPQWNGLRRIKNVIMILEWAPERPCMPGEDSDAPDHIGEGFRLRTPEEHVAEAPEMTQERQDSLRKAFLNLSGGRPEGLGHDELTHAIQAITDVPPTSEEVAAAIQASGSTGDCVNMEGFMTLLKTRHLLPVHHGRYYVAVSLAEAETIRRVLHVRGKHPLVADHTRGVQPEVALRYSPLASPGKAMLGDGGVAFDTSAGWRRDTSSNQSQILSEHPIGNDCTGATAAEAAIAQSVFRYFDGDMHFTPPQLNVLIRSLQASSVLERERFFSSTVGVRRRMDRKWQETPLAKVFTCESEFSALKQRAQAIFVRQALAGRNLKKWEAFMAFDSDDNGLLGPAEVYGALRHLQMPDLTPDDVIDFLSAGDVNGDGMLNYKEFVDLLNQDDEEEEEEEEEDTANGKDQSEAASERPGKSTQEGSMEKVPAYGADEIRDVLAARRRREQDLLRAERIRRETRQAELEHAIFEEELAASASRVGGANPDRRPPASETDSSGYYSCVFKFDTNKTPLRTIVTGKEAQFQVVMVNTLLRNALGAPITCPGCEQKLRSTGPDMYEVCKLCKRAAYRSGGAGVEWRCKKSWRYSTTECYRYFLCNACYKGQRTESLRACSDTTQHETFLHCPAGTSLSLLLPSGAVLGWHELHSKLHDAVMSLLEAGNLFSGLDKDVPRNEERCQQVLETLLHSHDGTATEQAEVRWLLDTPAALERAVQATVASSAAGKLLGPRKQLLRGQAAAAFNLQATTSDDGLAVSSAQLLRGTRSDVSYSVAVEFRLRALPKQGHRAALIRFAPPPTTPGRHAKRQEATLYVDENGRLTGNSTFSVQEHEQMDMQGLYPGSGNVHDGMKRVGLEAWIAYFEKHLPANVQSVERLRATTAADLLVDGLPIVGPEKVKKLETHLKSNSRLLKRWGSPPKKVEMPMLDGKTRGFAFLEFDTPEQAAKAKKNANGFKLDKSHVLLTNLMADYSRVINTEQDAETTGQVLTALKKKLQPEPEPEPEQETHPPGTVPELSPSQDQQPSDQKAEQKQARGPVVAGRWQVLVAAVDCLRGSADCLSIYIDGTLTNHGLTGSDLAGDNGLSLGARIVLLGGGKQSESRGGDLRKVHLVDGCVTAAQAAALSAQLLCENPLMHHAAVTIQARVRRLLARKRCAKERGLKSTSELPGNNLRVDSTDDDY